MDRLLDCARAGPLHLARPEIASLVVRAVLEGQDVLNHYTLHAFVVMSIHVHILITPNVAVPKVMQRLKGATARWANELLQRRGKPFWQEESYDHWARDEREFRRIQAYIEENPVRAGLAATACEFPWSSASEPG